MENEQKLILFESQREYVFREIQILYDLTKYCVSDKSKLREFKSRFKRVENVRKEFIDLVNKINALKLTLKPKEPIDYLILESFDELYHAIIAFDEECLPPPDKSTKDAECENANLYSKPLAEARLPKIELPKFDGNIEEWQTFYDTFLSLIHYNDRISSIEKFHYMLSCLSGSALSIARGLPVTSDNYIVVFDALVERFQNKRILATNYLDKICNYPPLKSCNLSDLRKLTGLLQESVNALKSVKIPNLDEFILFYLASRGLDKDTRKRYETYRIQSQSEDEKQQMPTFADLLLFLQGYVKVLEATEGIGSDFNQLQLQVRNNNNNRSPNYRSDFNKPKHWSRTSSFPINTGPYSTPGPYSESGPDADPHADPYSVASSYRSPGTYYNTGSDSENYDREDYQNNNFRTEVYATTNKFPVCVCCGYNHHSIYKCPLFNNISLTERRNLVESKNICVNCLRTNHKADTCFSKSTCSVCNQRHHTLLHESNSAACAGTSSVSLQNQTEPEFRSVVNSSTSLHVGHGRAHVLLGTCVVHAHGPAGVMKVRALIDSGAQDCFMTSACVKRLGLPVRRCNISVAGLGQNTVHQVKGVTVCTIHPCDAENPRFEITPIVMDTITNQMPSVEVPVSVCEAYKHLVLADKTFHKPSDIDLLIGAELFHDIYDGQRLERGRELPVALHSVFGWVIMGKFDPGCRPPMNTSTLLASTFALDNLIKKFWEVEEPPSILTPKLEDKKCEELYSELVTRNSDGRYVVPMLVKESHEPLGDSFGTSQSRFFNLEKRLVRDHKLKQDYSNFMNEYSDLGHMLLVKTPVKKEYNVIPHHCVLRPESMSTKLRVVFDASAKTSNGVALNDIVYTGPKMQNDIVDIITKFRLHNIAFTADISKMYRNIDLRPEDRKYQHILWRNTSSEPIQEFELNTVTYGVSSSPYLAIRTLHQLAQDHGAEYPRAAEVLKQDTFMDDITAGAPSVKEANIIKNELITLLSKAKFDLRKWSSNSPEFLDDLPSDHCQVPKAFCDEENQHTLKILGIQWDPKKDNFTYAVSAMNKKSTKRTLLSNVARLYDPLGWLTPVILTAKLIIQELWRRQLNWDESLPDDLHRRWQEFVEELPNIQLLSIPRQATHQHAKRFELIGFCDGSSKAYGCCVYLLAVSSSNITSKLLIAKSKVAPIKPLTINRLELLGAVLLAKVIKHMFVLLQKRIKIVSVTAFTDSRTVLAWLKTEPYKLKTFVSHRVVRIADDVKVESWMHVSTHDNPADYCSRGLRASELVKCQSWWSGPAWLAESKANWPLNQATDHITENSLPELKTATLHSTMSDQQSDRIANLIQNYSSFPHLQRVFAWCLRFISNVRAKTKLERCCSSVLSTDELKHSLNLLIKHEQVNHFAEDIICVKSQESCSRGLQKLGPFIDPLGLLRVGGRLKNSNLSDNSKHPFLLPKHSHFSILLVDYYHRLYLHCGPRTLQSLLQRNFWILGIRNLIRARLAKCVICFKVKPIASQPLMGDLPSSRVQPARCFQKVGLDFAGPFTIKESKRRNARTYKVYVCVFVCLVSKAVHLEVVSELSTPAFIAAFDRFVSRRGVCSLVISDNGTNFIGAKRYLSETHRFLLDKQIELDSDLSQRGIKWKLNPPTGSHFGGIFESGVKSMKYHLKRVVGLQVLTFEELSTVLSKVEAILNSRPLCLMSADPTEVDVLTPGHFLTGGPLVALPEPLLEEKYLPPRERWQMLQKLTQGFWRIWQRDYLHTLQQKTKWYRGQKNVQLNDVVLIMETNLPPLEWRCGKIIQLHPGSDGIVRVVTVRTTRGLLKRPVNKICSLPIHD